MRGTIITLCIPLKEVCCLGTLLHCQTTALFCVLCFVFCCNDLIVGLWNAIDTIRPTVYVAVVATSRLLQCVYVCTYVGVQYIL